MNHFLGANGGGGGGGVGGRLDGRKMGDGVVFKL